MTTGGVKQHEQLPPPDQIIIECINRAAPGELQPGPGTEGPRTRT
jgi:hypothetical protein